MIDINENKDIIRLQNGLKKRKYNVGHGGIVKTIPVVKGANFRVDGSLLNITLTHNINILSSDKAFSSYLTIEIEYNDPFMSMYNTIHLDKLPKEVRDTFKGVDFVFSKLGYADFHPKELTYVAGDKDLNKENIKKYIYNVADKLPDIAKRVNLAFKSMKKKGRM